MEESKSQVGQDIYVLEYLNYKTDGFFVELGASDGITLSNTYLLEKKYHWTGVLIEPSFEYESLVKNRHSQTFKECVSDSEKVLNFIECKDTCTEAWASYSHPHNSMLEKNLDELIIINNCETVKRIRPTGVLKKVKTTTLESILDKAKAPNVIDYLSLDVEGEEYNILKNFPFNKYKFRIMTVETNGAEPVGTMIRELLHRNGYTFITSLQNLDLVFCLNEE
ncbi:FkbM family methyltransferase [bacterium]|nr:FkbM family methyltransferase [bacterium]